MMPERDLAPIVMGQECLLFLVNPRQVAAELWRRKPIRASSPACRRGDPDSSGSELFSAAGAAAHSLTRRRAAMTAMSRVTPYRDLTPLSLPQIQSCIAASRRKSYPRPAATLFRPWREFWLEAIQWRAYHRRPPTEITPSGSTPR
jgi:hypothetical protein